jgi:hypothetical protein
LDFAQRVLDGDPILKVNIAEKKYVLLIYPAYDHPRRCPAVSEAFSSNRVQGKLFNSLINPI